jgi:hypothetical protein
MAKCDADRLQLAQLDNDRQFRDLLDAANSANASFYPIDPRGLAVFDTPIVRLDVPGPPPPPTISPSADLAMLRGRINSLRTLADATDGLAIVDSNNLAGGLKRVVDDLSSYYLIGYYSTGRLDGKFHQISVRVKRPGVRVRARRGYLAATPATAAATARAATAKSATTVEPAEAAAAHAVEAADGRSQYRECRRVFRSRRGGSRATPRRRPCGLSASSEAWRRPATAGTTASMRP